MHTNRGTGQNAIFVTEADLYSLQKDWPWKWLSGREVHSPKALPPEAAPDLLLEDFESVTDLGVQDIKLGDRVFRRVQIFACRNLR